MKFTTLQKTIEFLEREYPIDEIDLNYLVKEIDWYNESIFAGCTYKSEEFYAEIVATSYAEKHGLVRPFIYFE
jgi:hypothetical protein